MTTVLMIASSLILLVLILWRGRSPEFRKRSEYPKFRFLANLGIQRRRSAPNEPDSENNHADDSNLISKENHEEHEP